MPDIRDRIRRLWPVGSSGKISAIAATIPHAGPREINALATELLALAGGPKGEAALTAIVGVWEHLSAEARSTALTVGRGRWRPLLSRLLEAGTEPERLGAARVAASLADPELLGAVVRALGAGTAEQAEAVEHALCETARLVGEEDEAERRIAVARALIEAIDGYERHRRSRIVPAAMRLLVSAGPAAGAAAGRFLIPLLRTAEHPVHMVIRGQVRRCPETMARAFALWGLAHASIKPACLERLARAEGPEAHEQALSRWHLLKNPARARRLERLMSYAKRPGQWLPENADLRALSDDARMGYIAMAGATPMPARARDAALGAVLGDTSAAVRHAAVREATACRAGACLNDLCSDRDERVALSAALALVATAEADALIEADRERLLAALAQSPHERVRALAAGIRAAGRPGSPGFALVALGQREMIARAVAGSPADPRQLATAVMQVGHARLPGVEPLLRSAATLDDVRVRANAIDAMVHAARPRWMAAPAAADATLELLLDRALDPEHRIRANCARGLLLAARGGGRAEAAESPYRELAAAGAQTACAMLGDQRPMHRIAGLWLVERLAGDLAGAPGVMDRVSWLTRGERTALERARAERCAGRLMAEVRHGWARGPRARGAALEAAA